LRAIVDDGVEAVFAGTVVEAVIAGGEHIPISD
jgi:hypothetical protein